MTIEELAIHIRAVVDYNMPAELRDAAENGTEGHIINHLIALDNFLGAQWDHSEVTDAGGHRYVACFTPEAWIGDVAVEVDADGEQHYDVTDYVLANPAYWQEQVSEEIAHGDVDEDYAWEHSVLDRDDRLKLHPNAPEWVRAWSGPFSIRVTRTED